MKKLDYIDALRGLAILAVLLVHCAGYGTNNYPDIMQKVLGNGGRGVQLFFVVSAFTLFLSLNNRKLKKEEGYSNFFIRRFFRVAPMFYLAIVYHICERTFFGNLSIDPPPNITLWSITSSFSFLHGLSPYWINTVVPGGWSIAAEMMFYCLIPLLFSKIKKMNHALIAFFVAIFLQHSITFLVKQVHFADLHLMRDFLYYFFPNHLPAFICGIILYFLVYTPKETWNINPYLILLVALTSLFQIVTGSYFYSFHILFSVSFVILAYSLSKKEFMIIVNPATIFIGKISYSMYFIHFIVLHWMNKMGVLDFVALNSVLDNIFNFVIRFSFVLAISAAVSYLTYRIIEVPFQGIGRAIIKKRKKQNETVV